MRFLYTALILFFSITISLAQRQEFLPTIDIGLNGGVSYANLFDYKGQLKVGGLSLMANTGFNRHILEFDLGNSLNSNGLEYDLSGVMTVPNPFMTLEPTTLNLNYTFARELFAYYPACMIRNQLLLGLRLNAEVLMGNSSYGADTISTYFSSKDYGRYSADLTLITDYHLNKSNYLVLQLYTPILSYFAYPQSLATNTDRPFEFDDRMDVSKSYFFKNGELGWINQHSKLGINVTYRLLLIENFALQLKYNGKLNSSSKIDMMGNLPVVAEIKENYHQITFGIVGHIIRPPIGF